MYKAIICSIENNGYQAKVRIPFFNRVEDTLGSTPDFNLYTASIFTPPGLKPSYVVGDIVYVDFENNDNSLPVILGLLYREGSLSSTDIDAQSLNVDVSTYLPEDTSIGNVNKDNIKTLTRVFDIQSDSNNGGGSSVDPYNLVPFMDGVGNSGTSDLYARGDHRHPSDTNKANISSVPASASVDSSNVMSFESSGGDTLFSVQLPGSGGGGTPSDIDPLMDGAASAGVSDLYARGDHRHPSDTTIPISASIDTNGLISFESSQGTTLFTLQLPFYDGSVGGIDAIYSTSSPYFFQNGVISINDSSPIYEETAE